jgi:RNA polymerase sigma factor (sigma-70 family)
VTRRTDATPPHSSEASSHVAAPSLSCRGRAWGGGRPGIGTRPGVTVRAAIVSLEPEALCAPGPDEDSPAAIAPAEDDDAWSALWQKYFERLTDYAAALLAGESGAEDVASEVLIRMMGRLAVAPSPGALSAYLHTAARNLIVDLRRARDRERRAFARLEIDPRVEAPEPVDRLDLTGRLAVAGALNVLPERQRYVLVRMLVEEASITEVAGELQITANATSQLAYRARAGFRRALLASGSASAVRYAQQASED